MTDSLRKAAEMGQPKENTLVEKLDSVPLDARLTIGDEKESRYIPIGFWCSEAVSVLKQINPFLETLKLATQSEKASWRYADALAQQCARLTEASKMALEALRNTELCNIEQLNAMYALQEALDNKENQSVLIGLTGGKWIYGTEDPEKEKHKDRLFF